MKDLAWGFTVKAAEKAKDMKEKTNVMINNIQNKYGNKQTLEQNRFNVNLYFNFIKLNLYNKISWIFNLFV